MSGPILDPPQMLLLRTILARGAENASIALSKWLDRPVRLEVRDLDQVDIAVATAEIGPEDSLVAACSMPLSGGMVGYLILVFEDRSGLALADLVQSSPVGTAADWGEMERSAAQETANIVGCAYVNALSSHLPGAVEPIEPGPPEFRHEFAASLLESALLDQASELDRVLLVQTRFHAEPADLGWSLLLVPTAETLRRLAAALRD